MTPEQIEAALRNLAVVFAARGFAPDKVGAIAAALADVDLAGDPGDIIAAVSAAQTANTDPLP